MFSGLLALVLLVPGALLFGLGASALSRRAHGVRDVEDSSDVPALAPQQALIIPFPRRALTDG
jgi:ABC-type Na+ efflux pump permease subunit